MKLFKNYPKARIYFSLMAYNADFLQYRQVSLYSTLRH